MEQALNFPAAVEIAAAGSGLILSG